VPPLTGVVGGSVGADPLLDKLPSL
jgi:hypothetical protein